MSLNNYSPIGWHQNVRHLHHERWHSFGQRYCLPVPTGELLPFQLFRPNGSTALFTFKIVAEDGTETDVLSSIQNTGFKVTIGEASDNIRYLATGPLAGSWSDGYHYAVMSDGRNTWVSDWWNWVGNTEGLIRVDYWHDEDVATSEGVLDYSFPFRWRVYLRTDLSKPTYQFESEVDTRNTVVMPYRRSRHKLYRFTAILSEYMADAVSLIGLHNHVTVDHLGSKIIVDEWRMGEPSWIDRGDLAGVDFEFRAATLVTTTARSAPAALNPAACGVAIDYTADQYLLVGSNEYPDLSEVAGLVSSYPTHILFGRASAFGVALYSVLNESTIYLEQNVADGSAAFARNTGKYYLYDTGLWQEPAITSIGDAPNYTITALTLPTEVLVEYRTANGSFTRAPGTFTQSQLSTGVNLGPLGASDWQEVRLVMRTDQCGELFTTGPSLVNEPNAPQLSGIGYDAIGSTAIA